VQAEGTPLRVTGKHHPASKGHPSRCRSSVPQGCAQLKELSLADNLLAVFQSPLEEFGFQYSFYRLAFRDVVVITSYSCF